jgi:hypothetical protein
MLTDGLSHVNPLSNGLQPTRLVEFGDVRFRISVVAEDFVHGIYLRILRAIHIQAHETFNLTNNYI